MNSEAIIDEKYNFVSGVVNLFYLGYNKDSDGSYHAKMLEEFLDENDKFKWDLIQ